MIVPLYQEVGSRRQDWGFSLSSGPGQYLILAEILAGIVKSKNEHSLVTWQVNFRSYLGDSKIIIPPPLFFSFFPVIPANPGPEQNRNPGRLLESTWSQCSFYKV